jgi:membrane protein YqaA with SNARE-associated domain
MTNSWVGAGMPFGVDALVIYLASTYGEVFWIFPLIVTMGSLATNALTYWLGRCAGDAGLPRLLAPGQLDRMKARVEKAGAGRLAAAAVLPPPFPLTPFVLTCGAVDLDRRRFFIVFGLMRLIRFVTLAVLARHYGDRVRQLIESQQLQTGATVLALVAFAVMIATIVVLFRRTRPLLA